MDPSPRTTPSPGPAAPSGTISGRYLLRRKLGSGSTGTVYLAQDRVRDALVALKVIRAERVTSKSIALLQKEFRAIASLRHPQIAAAYDFGYTEGGLPFYTREYIPGLPLPPGPPDGEDPRAFLKPILHLLDALVCLHDHGILHLDVHAGNLIVSENPKRGSVLIDFGLVRSPGDIP